MAFKKATISIDDWLKSTGATERPRAQQDTADAQKPVTKPISEPVPQKKKENISFWEKLLNAFGDAGYSADTTTPLALTNQAISDDYRKSNMQESKTAEAGGNIAKSAYEGAKSAYENAAGTFLNKRSGTQIMGVTVADNAVPQEDKDKAEAARKRNQESIYAKADKAAAAAAEASEKAKDNLGGSKAAGAFVDIASGGLQLGADMALNALLPGAGLANMGLRSYGSGSREARLDGASEGEQVAYGAAAAAVDVLTEKIFDVGKLFGGGAADDVAEKLVGKLAKTDAGRSVVRVLTNAIGEGAEEAVADILNPAIRAIYDKGAAAKSSYTTAEGAKEMLAQSAYDAMIGAALSTFGTAAGIAKGIDAQKNAALRAGEPAANVNAEASAKPAEVENIAAEAQAEAAPVETAQDASAAQEKPQENSTLRMVEEAAGLREPAQSPAQEQSQKTGEIVNESAGNAVESQNSDNFAGVQQQEAETDAGQRGTLPEGQGAKSAEFGYDEAKTQARSLKNLFKNGDREKLGLTEQDLSHKVEHDAEAEAKAQERFESDYEGEKADLFGEKRDWDKADTLLANKIMGAELDKAHKSGSMDDYAEVARLVKRWYAQGTDVGQVMQMRQVLSKSPKLMEASAVELLMDEKRTRKMTAEKRKELLDAVTENANRLKDIPEGDTAEVVSLIKDLSSIRKTNGIWFGNVERRMSKAMNGALDYAADMEGGEAFLREIAATQIVNIAKDYALPSHIERVKTWRYLSMLSKPATAARNYVGNNVMNVVDATSQNCGVPLDMLLSRYTGVRAVPLDKGLAGKDRKKGADDAGIKSFIEIGLDADTSGNRSKMETKTGRSNKMTGNFIERLVSTFEKYSNYAMVATDQRQKGGIEAEAQRGIRELERAGKVNKGALDSRPQELAKERTFQNDSKIAQATSGVRRAFNIFSIKDKRGGSFGVGDLILPFTNVPGNIADTAIQHSPFGFIRAGAEVAKVVGKIKGAQLTVEEREGVQSKLERAYKRAKSGELTKEEHAALWRDVASVIQKSSGVELMPKQRDSLKKAVDQYLIHAQNGAKAQCEAAVSEMANLLAKAKAGALTAPEQAKAVTDFGRAFNGTMGIAFFAVLAGAGIMKVAGDDDKDKEALEKSEGVSGTQLNTSALVRLVSGGSAKWQDGDTLVSIGFLDPINAQMTYGALLADCYEEDGKITFGDVTRENLSSIYQSVMDLPAMSQIQEIENSFKYSKADTTGGKLADATFRYGASQATSFIPNIVSGIGQGIDGKVRDTYNGDTTEENAWRAAKNKTIFLRQTNPVALDSWGNEKTYGDSAAMNFLNATLNPGSVTKYRTSAVNQELYRLESMNIDVKYPEKKAPLDGSRNGKDVDLTQDERRQYQMAYGQTAYDNIQKVIRSSVYKQSSDVEKASAIQNLLEVATAAGKKKAKLDGGDAPSWTTKSDGSVADNAVYRAKLGTAKDTLPANARDRHGDVMQAIIKTVVGKRGGSDQLALNVMAQQLKEGTQEKVETAYNGGYELKQIVDFYQAMYAKKPGTSQKKYKKPDLYAWAMQNGYTAKQFNQLWKLFS